MRCIALLLLVPLLGGCLDGPDQVAKPTKSLDPDLNAWKLGDSVLRYDWSTKQYEGDLALQWIFSGQGTCFAFLGMAGQGYHGRGPFVHIDAARVSFPFETGQFRPAIYGQEALTDGILNDDSWGQRLSRNFDVAGEAVVTMAAHSLKPQGVLNGASASASFVCESSVSLDLKRAGTDVIRWTSTDARNATGADLLFASVANSEYIEKTFGGESVEWFLDSDSGIMSGSITHPEGVYPISSDGTGSRIPGQPGDYVVEFNHASVSSAFYDLVIYSLTDLDSFDDIVPLDAPREVEQLNHNPNSVIWSASNATSIGGVWHFSGDGSCFVSFTVSTPGDADQEAAFGVDQGNGFDLLTSSSPYVTARTEQTGPAQAPSSFTGSATTTTFERQLSVDGFMRLVLVAPKLESSPRLPDATAMLAWACDEDVRLESLDAVRDPVFWSPEHRDETGFSAWGAHVHESRAQRSYDAPIVELARRMPGGLAYVDGTLTLIHPEGQEEFDLDDPLIRFTGGPGDYDLAMSSRGMEFSGFTLLLDRTPVQHMEELAMNST